MKRAIFKKTLAFFLAVAMVITLAPLMPGTVKEVKAAAKDNTVIYVNSSSGTTTLDETALTSDVDRLATEGWKWDAAKKQLQLSGFDGAGVESDGDLNIVLTGTNTITMPKTGPDWGDLYGVRSTTGTVTIIGDGAGERDSLTIQQTDIQECRAYWYGISSESYTVNVNIEDCDVKINLGGENASYNQGYRGIFGKVYVKGNANIDIDIDNGYADGISTLYAETTGNIDIDLGDPNPADDKAVRGQRCVGDLNASGTGSINLSVAGEDGEALRGRLLVGEAAGAITAKGMLTMPKSYIYQKNLFDVADSKAITSLDGSSQYGIAVVDTNDAELIDHNSNAVTEWKIATVENNPLVFLDSAYLDQASSKTGDTWDIDDYMTGLVYGGKKPYSFKATGMPDGITLWSSWPSIKLAGTFESVSDAGTITVTVTDANGAKASIDVAYGAIAPKAPVTGVALDKEEAFVNVNEMITLHATIIPDDATITDVGWLITGAVTHVKDGMIIGKNPGIATVTVKTVQGGFTDTCTVYVREKKPVASQDESNITNLVANAKYTIDGVEYTADEFGQIAIDPSWRLETLEIVKVNDEAKCNSEVQELTIAAQPLKDSWVTLEYNTFVYDGTAKTPAVVVKDGETTLVKDTDYTVVYADNTLPGTATVTITGKGNYSGTIEKIFYINGIDIWPATFTLSQTEYVYDGTAHEPDVIVELDGKTLVKGTDYTVAYKDNVKAGTAKVTVTGTGVYEGSRTIDFTIVKPENDLFDDSDVVRVKGSTRYGTSAEISESFVAEDDADAIIIVNGTTFPDALAAGPFAKSINAPILMVNGKDAAGKLDAAVKAEIDRIDSNHNAKIYIIGGTGAVSDSFVTTFENMGYTSIERVKGANRYKTAIELAKRAGGKTAFITNSENYPDALGAGSAAALNDGVILFTQKDKLAADTATYLQEGDFDKIIILGGTGVVSDAVADQLKAICPDVTRVKGKGRCETSVEVAKAFFPTTDTIVVATAWNFADALAGGPFAADLDAPIILLDTKANKLKDDMTQYVKDAGVEHIVVLGGTGAVSDKLYADLENLLK